LDNCHVKLSFALRLNCAAAQLRCGSLYGDGVFRRSLDAPMKNGHPKGLPVVSVINLRDCPWRFDHEPAPRCPVGGCAAAQGQWAQHFPELPSCRDPFA
jgi:hypothetical protein